MAIKLPANPNTLRRTLPVAFIGDWDIVAGSTVAEWEAAFAAIAAEGYTQVSIPFASVSFASDVDCSGLQLVCRNTQVDGNNTFVNHAGIIRGVVSGVDTSRHIAPVGPALSYRVPKVLQKIDAAQYRVYIPKENPAKGAVEITYRNDVVDAGANSIGGACDFRATLMRNVNKAVPHLHTFSASSAGPLKVLRDIPGGTGGVQLGFWVIDPGQWVEWTLTQGVDVLSVGALCTPASGQSATVRFDGVDVATFSGRASAETMAVIRQHVLKKPGVVRVTNNDATDPVYISGVNHWEVGEGQAQGESDKLSYNYRDDDYTTNQGAHDYALARYGDLTGGSFHGGETINSSNIKVDGVVNTLAAGGLVWGQKIEHISNVTVTWPSDGATAAVVKVVEFGDGGMKKYIRIDGGALEFESVWTCMMGTNEALSAVRGSTERGTGVTATMKTFDRVGYVEQDAGLITRLKNWFTIFDNEKNANGGPYINEVVGTYHKLYYGPILFNRARLGTVHAEQLTVYG